MATAQASRDMSPFAERAQRRQLEAALRTLHADDWEERLSPLAQHLAAQKLARACGHTGAGHLRQLDLTLLREALSSLLRDDLTSGALIVHVVVEGQDPAQVAAERGVSRPALVEQLRDAVNSLACRYELLASGHLNQSPALSVRTARGGKRG